MANVVSIPAPGVRSINSIQGNGLNIDLISSDSSVLITPNSSTREIDLQVLGTNSGTLIMDVLCDISVFIGACVRMDSLGTAYNADASTVATSNVMGVVIAKPTPTTANVRVAGLTEAVFSGLDPTFDYFLSDTSPGELTTTVPTLANHVVVRIGKPYSADRLVILQGDRYVRS